MHKNAVWIAFLLIVMGFGTWFVVKGGYAIIDYYKFSLQVPATIEKWEVDQRGANKYALIASYSYAFDGKNYRGEGQLGDLYPNPWAANRALEKYKEQKWDIWINPKTPQKAALEKKFPYKGTISAAVILGLVIYFICLGLYVGVKNEQGC